MGVGAEGWSDGGVKSEPAGTVEGGRPQSEGQREEGEPLRMPSSQRSPGSKRLLPQKGASTSVQIAEQGEPICPFCAPRSHSSGISSAFTGLPPRRMPDLSLIMPSPQKEGTEHASDLGQVTPGLRGQVLSSGSQRQVVPLVPAARLQEAGSEVQTSPRSQVSPGESSPSPQRGRAQRFLSLQRRGKGQSASVSQEAKQRPWTQRPLSHWALSVQD